MVLADSTEIEPPGTRHRLVRARSWPARDIGPWRGNPSNLKLGSYGQGGRSVDQSTERTNVDALVQAGELIKSGFADHDNHPFADDFVFHFFNPQLPDLDGDYHGFDGIADLFKRLAELSETGFRQVHHSLTPCGDELFVAFVTNTLSFDDMMIDVDAVVVWRVFGGQIHEAWDIPAVNTVRPHQPGRSSVAAPATGRSDEVRARTTD